MAKPPTKRIDALEDMIAEQTRFADDFVRQNRAVIDAVQQQAKLLQAGGIYDEITRSALKMQRALELPDISTSIADKLTASSRAFNGMHDLATQARQISQRLPDEAVRSLRQLVDSVKFSIPDVEALTGANQLREMVARQQRESLEGLSRMIPASAIAELALLSDSARLAVDAWPTIDPDILKGWAGVDSYDRVVARAEKIAQNPESATTEDVQAIFADVAEMAAKAPASDRMKLGPHLERLAWWLFGLAVEDDVKKLMAALLLLVQMSFCGPGQLAPASAPQPPEVLPPAAAPPSMDWQIAGVPEIVRRAGPRATQRTIEFFAAEIRNRNTRQAYMRAIIQFFNWCDDRNIELEDITPFAVAAYVEEIQKDFSAPSVKQHLAAIRMYFDYLVVGQVLPMNPAASVRGPRHVVKRGKTSVLTSAQARQLLDAIDTTSIIGLRDRALIGVMVYSFARVSATVGMKVGDYYPNGKRWWLRLHEKGGKRHEVPAHHNAEAYLDAYIKAGEFEDDKKGPLFRTIGRDRRLTDRRMHRADVLRMIYRRAQGAGLEVHVCCHTFRATGITAYLENGGTIEKAQQIAAHESPRTTKLYDRTNDELTLDEIERIVI